MEGNSTFTSPEVNVTSAEVDAHFPRSQRHFAGSQRSLPWKSTSLRRSRPSLRRKSTSLRRKSTFTWPEVNVHFAGSQRSLRRKSMSLRRKSTFTSPESHFTSSGNQTFTALEVNFTFLIQHSLPVSPTVTSRKSTAQFRGSQRSVPGTQRSLPEPQRSVPGLMMTSPQAHRESADSSIASPRPNETARARNSHVEDYSYGFCILDPQRFIARSCNVVHQRLRTASPESQVAQWAG